MRICEHPVFVVGAPRSGTSILPWSLAQHTQFWTSRESELLWNLCGNGKAEQAFEMARNRPEGTWLGEQRVEKAEFLAFLGLGLNALYSSRSNGNRWIEQSPINTLIIDNLADMFPGALFLHILRDGRSVVHSMRNFTSAMTPQVRETMAKAGTLPNWAVDIAAAADTWRRFIETASQFESKRQDRCLTVLNEQLAIDPRSGFARIFDFLKVDYEEAPVEFFRNNRMNSSFPAGAPRPRDPWNQWTPQERKRFFAAAGQTLVRYKFAAQDELLNWAWPETALPFDAALLCKAILANTPPQASVAIVSRDAESMLPLNDRIVETLSPAANCADPSFSRELLENLRTAAARDIQFLAFPRSSAWWPDYYREVRQELETRYHRFFDNETCTIYASSKALPAAQLMRRQGIVDVMGLRKAISRLGDDQWLDVLIKGIDDPIYKGFALPELPAAEVQRRLDGRQGELNLRAAFGFYKAIKTFPPRYKRTLRPISRILDFGCGWGRLSMFFLKDVIGDRLFGLDFDPGVIEHCNRAMPYGSFTLAKFESPTAFPSGYFDLVFAVSLFAHLNETLHLKWVEEIARILKPGGIFLAITQRRSFIESCASLRQRAAFEHPWQEAAAKSFLDPEAAFADYDSGKFLFSPVPNPIYGQAILSQKYVQKNWSEFLEVTDFLDDPGFLPQPLIVARKPAHAARKAGLQARPRKHPS